MADLIVRSAAKGLAEPPGRLCQAEGRADSLSTESAQKAGRVCSSGGAGRWLLTRPVPGEAEKEGAFFCRLAPKAGATRSPRALTAESRPEFLAQGLNDALLQRIGFGIRKSAILSLVEQCIG